MSNHNESRSSKYNHKSKFLIRMRVKVISESVFKGWVGEIKSINKSNEIKVLLDNYEYHVWFKEGELDFETKN